MNYLPPITTNGEVEITTNDNKSSILYVSGVMGGASLEIVFKGRDETTISYGDTPITQIGRYLLDHGVEARPYFLVTNVTGSTNINVDVGLS